MTTVAYPGLRRMKQLGLFLPPSLDAWDASLLQGHTPWHINLLVPIYTLVERGAIRVVMWNEFIFDYGNELGTVKSKNKTGLKIFDQKQR